MKEAGIGGAPKVRVVKLAQLAKKSGVDGVVASVQEARAIRKACGREFLIVTPGVRPKDKDGATAKHDDQARTATPTEAIRAGADYLVVCRPILTAEDPRAAAQSHGRRNRCGRSRARFPLCRSTHSADSLGSLTLPSSLQ